MIISPVSFPIKHLQEIIFKLAYCKLFSLQPNYSKNLTHVWHKKTSSDNVTQSSGSHQVLTNSTFYIALESVTFYGIHFHGQHHNPSHCYLLLGLLKWPEVTPSTMFMKCRYAHVSPRLQTFRCCPNAVRTKNQGPGLTPVCPQPPCSSHSCPISAPPVSHAHSHHKTFAHAVGSARNGLSLVSSKFSLLGSA